MLRSLTDAAASPLSTRFQTVSLIDGLDGVRSSRMLRSSEYSEFRHTDGDPHSRGSPSVSGSLVRWLARV
jgi:hypothetical protein